MNVTVRRLPLLLLSVAGILSAQILHAQSVATNPVGYNMFTLPPGNSVRVNTFVQATAFQGTASAVTSSGSSVITLSSSATALTSDTYDEVSGEPAYYVEILDSGTAQGLIADVVSNTANTITVDYNLIPYGVSPTCSFLVRPHTTLGTLFPSTSGFAPGTDQIELLFPNGSPQTYIFTGATDNTVWVTSSGNPAGNQIIYPGQGFIVYVQNGKTVPVVGYVKPGQTQVPLYAGVNNIVGTMNPVVSGTQILSNFNFPASLTAGGEDTVKTFVDNGQLQAAGSYGSAGSYMYNTSSGTSSDTVSVLSPNAVIVNVQHGKNWIMPSFYTSGN
jgi:uncharacterized protein (TIGR02597 family)